MFGSIGQPLSPSYYMTDLHFPVIDYISEMVGWPTISFGDNEIIKFICCYFAKYLIFELINLKLFDIRFDPNNILLPIFYFSNNLVY